MGLKNPSQALKSNVDPLDLHLMETIYGGKRRQVNFVNESGPKQGNTPRRNARNL